MGMSERFESNVKALEQSIEARDKRIYELEKELAKLNHQWISVKDQLPPPETQVLYYIPAEDGFPEHIDTGGRLGKYWSVGSDDEEDNWNGDLITHWMLLPESPTAK